MDSVAASSTKLPPVPPPPVLLKPTPKNDPQRFDISQDDHDVPDASSISPESFPPPTGPTLPLSQDGTDTPNDAKEPNPEPSIPDTKPNKTPRASKRRDPIIIAQLRQVIEEQNRKYDAEMASCSIYMETMRQNFASALGRDRADQEAATVVI